MKYILLYLIFLLYSVIAVLEKTVSGFEFFSKEFYLFYSLQLFLLFIYAVAWQKILKRFTLSVAYINKGSVFIFNAIWSILLFNEKFHIKEIVGIVIVFIGIVFINRRESC